MGQWFGTDGIRGSVDSELFSDLFLGAFARGLVLYLRETSSPEDPLCMVLGRDTRASGVRIVARLCDVLSACGVKVLDGGIVPTPAVALAVSEYEAQLGIAVTASHNPASDNGLKLFNRDGTKFSVEDEVAIEAAITRELTKDSSVGLSTLDGTVQSVDLLNNYIQYVIGLRRYPDLRGMRIVLDTANGATCVSSPRVLELLGAEVIQIGGCPDGANINQKVGSEYPDILSRRVVEEKADLGIAHDGDGDRVVVVDEKGAVLPGDIFLGILALHRLKEDALSMKTLVVTQMSNLGLDRAIEKGGGRVVRTGVGDREVFYAMIEGGYELGGESSGHIIVRACLSTGDGLIAGLELLRTLRLSKQKLSKWIQKIKLFPSRLVNLKVKEKKDLEAFESYRKCSAAVEGLLGQRGRLLVRYSGTEPKLRLLVEAETISLVDRAMSELEAAVRLVLEVVD